MQIKSTPHIFALVALLIMILVGQAGAQGFVWCLGEDHSALEYAADKACDTDAQQTGQGGHEGAGLGISLPDEDCGPCFDIATTLDATSGHNHKRYDFSAVVVLPSATQTTPRPLVTQVLAAQGSPRDVPRTSQTILFQRTVVLLT